MKIFFALFLLTVFGSVAHASPEPCRYPTPAKAYEAAELAVVGKVVGKAANGTDQRFTIERVVKGKAGSEITLHGQQALNTEWNGFALPENQRIFLMLTQDSSGPYSAVAGFNSACPVYYPVQNGALMLNEPNSDKKLMIPEAVIGVVLQKP